MIPVTHIEDKLEMEVATHSDERKLESETEVPG